MQPPPPPIHYQHESLYPGGVVEGFPEEYYDPTSFGMQPSHHQQDAPHEYPFSIYPNHPAAPTASTSSSSNASPFPPSSSSMEAMLDPALTTLHRYPEPHSMRPLPPQPSVPTVALGRTRCYWCILSPELDFVFLDPILHTHLGNETGKFLGTNLLDYVHPDEVDSLRKDLLPKSGSGDAGGVETGGVFGSVTRCRYSRVPRIRRIMGNAKPELADDANLYVLDDDYLQLRITTSWIGGVTTEKTSGTPKGAVLAFFHATEDKDSSVDNNEEHRTAWTNWCGPHVKDGPYLDPYRCSQLMEALQRVVTPSPPPTPRQGEDGPPPHVFQILDYQGRVIVSFPPAMGMNGQGMGYDTEEYAKLAREAALKPRARTDATTSCTRRYRSKHPVVNGTKLTTIESVVILYGAITFACFQTGGVYLTSNSRPSYTQHHHQQQVQQSQHSSSRMQFELEDVPNSKDIPQPNGAKRNGDDMAIGGKRARMLGKTHLAPSGTLDSLSISTSGVNRPHYTPKLDGDGRNGGEGNLSPTVATASAILGSFTNSPQQQDGGHYDFSRPNSAQQPPPNHVGYSAHPLQQSQYTYQQQHPLSQSYSFPPPIAGPSSQQYTTSPSLDSLARLPDLPPVGGDAELAGQKKGRKGDKTGPPVSKPGPKACESCGTDNSPEWRKGPSGTKSLCNACGLRYARSVARKAKQEAIADGTAMPNLKGKKAKAAAAAAAALAENGDASTSQLADGGYDLPPHPSPTVPVPILPQPPVSQGPAQNKAPPPQQQQQQQQMHSQQQNLSASSAPSQPRYAPYPYHSQPPPSQSAYSVPTSNYGIQVGVGQYDYSGGHDFTNGHGPHPPQSRVQQGGWYSNHGGHGGNSSGNSQSGSGQEDNGRSGGGQQQHYSGYGNGNGNWSAGH